MKKHWDLKMILPGITAVCIALVTMLALGVCHAPLSVYAEENSVNDNYQSDIDELVALVNEVRKDAGLNPLYIVPMLNDASYIRSKETVEKYDHTRPDGTNFYTVLDNCGFFFSAAAENLAAGLPTAEETHNQWINSPGHLRNILNPKYTHIGASCYHEDGTMYGWYWEELFIATDVEFEGQYIPERQKIIPKCCGDIDGDGNVSNLDFVILLKCLKKEVVLNDLQLESADCMLDGEITIADAIVFRKYILGIYDALPRNP